MKSSDLLSISEVAKRSGVAASALRFYEEKGLISSVRTGSGTGHRRFERHVLRRIAFIVFAQRVGLSLAEIEAELKRLPGGKLSRSEWAKLSSSWKKRVDAQLEQLQRMRETLTECIGCGCLSLGTCRFANPEDRVARNGSGARYWKGDRPVHLSDDW